MPGFRGYYATVTMLIPKSSSLHRDLFESFAEANAAGAAKHAAPFSLSDFATLLLGSGLAVYRREIGKAQRGARLVLTPDEVREERAP